MAETLAVESEQILVIASDAVILDQIETAFACEHYSTTRAFTGSAGLELLQSTPFSLVIIDDVLPDRPGSEVCRAIKRRDPLSPVICLLSASVAYPLAEERGHEADAYLVKPFEPAELLARVQSVLRTYAIQVYLARYSQQLQLVSDIGHHITSILDLDSLLWEVIRLTRGAFALGCVGVGLFDGDNLVWRFGLRDKQGEIRERVVSMQLAGVDFRLPIGGGQSNRLIADLVNTTDRLIAGELAAFRSRSLLPLVHGEHWLGALLVGSESGAEFQGSNRLILSTLAGQLAVAVVNARLVLAQRRETHIAQILAQTAQLLSQARDLAEIARAIVQRLGALTGVAHCAIGLWSQPDDFDSPPDLYADSPTWEESLRGLTTSPDAGLAARLKTCEPQIIPLALSRDIAPRILLGSGRSSLLLCPIAQGEQVWGALFLLGKPAYQFDAYDRSLSVGVAHQLAAAAVNADLLARLQREQSHLAAVLLSMHSGAFLVDGAGQIVYGNPQLGSIIGLPAETFLGHSYSILFHQISAHSGNAEKTRQQLDAALLNLAAFPVVHAALSWPTTAHVQLSFFPVKDAQGQGIGWGCVVTDAGDDQAGLSQMSDLLAGVSHELRAPLAAIKGFVAMLSGQQVYWGEDGRQAFLASINESADQLGRLIENILEMARIDAGVAWLRRRMVALEPIIQRAVQGFRQREPDREIAVFTGSDLPDLEIDPLRIEQLLRNLLENSVNRSPVGGQIVVRAERTNDEILISIADQGNSIPPDHLPHIFERFYPIGAAGPQSTGAGLGLYISRELVIAHGGRIWATSEPNRGATLRVALPVMAAADLPTAVPVRLGATRPARTVQTRESPAPTVSTILLVEDDVAAARVYKGNLELEGFKVQLANRGQVALDWAAQQSFDVVVLDLMLPDVDGFKVCEQLREFSTVPVIIVTGKAGEQDKLRGLSVGADDYLIKPVSARELSARVRAVIRRAHTSNAAENPIVLQFGPLRIDLARRQVYRRGSIVALTPHEYKLLSHLASHADQILTHKQLLAEVWGPEYGNDTQYLWVSISRLRRKIEDDPDRPRYIITDPKLGYHFCNNPE